MGNKLTYCFLNWWQIYKCFNPVVLLTIAHKTTAASPLLLKTVLETGETSCCYFGRGMLSFPA